LSAFPDPIGASDPLGGRLMGADGGAPVDGRGAASLLDRICRACVDSLPITGAAVSLMTLDGHRGIVSATDGTARRIEDAQYTTGEGPGVAAFETGCAVLVPDLDPSRTAALHAWPAFREATIGLPARALFAFPLRLGAASLGALTLFHVDVAVLEGANLATAVRLADAASLALLDFIAGMSDRAEASPSSVIDAEYFRSEIYQAAGMVMEQLGVNIEVAMVRLRSHAFAMGRPTGDVARDIVRRRLRFEQDND